jgi:hypothetical protein
VTEYNNKRIIWEGTPKQNDFLACSAREAIFGGAAGAGKTSALLWSAAYQINNKHHQALFLRRTFPMLRDVIALSHELFTPLGAAYSQQNSQWRFPSGARVEFGYCDTPDDVYRYQGREFSTICWDELTSWPADSTDSNGEPCSHAYAYLMSRLRAKEGSDLRLEVRASCTPNGPGLQWVKQRFAIPDSGEASVRRDPSTGLLRVFVPARIGDNVHLRGSEYERTLRSLPEAQRAALLDGKWTTLEGAVFGEFNYNVHVCDGFKIPREWRRWRSADDGYAAPAAVLWFCHDRDVNDIVYITRELYRARMTPETMAKEVLALDQGEGFSGLIDSSAFADVGVVSRGEQMNKLGCRWRACGKGAGSVMQGLSAIHARLALRDGGRSAGLKIFRGACPNLIRELTGLVHSTRQPEAYDPSCSDHAIAALRYGLLYRPIEGRRVRVTNF